MLTSYNVGVSLSRRQELTLTEVEAQVLGTGNFPILRVQKERYTEWMGSRRSSLGYAHILVKGSFPTYA